MAKQKKPVAARDKAGKFVELANARTSKALKGIQSLANLANRNSYEYTEAQVKEIFSALQTALDATHKRFEGKAPAAEGFKLSAK